MSSDVATESWTTPCLGRVCPSGHLPWNLALECLAHELLFPKDCSFQEQMPGQSFHQATVRLRTTKFHTVCQYVFSRGSCKKDIYIISTPLSLQNVEKFLPEEDEYREDDAYRETEVEGDTISAEDKVRSVEIDEAIHADIDDNPIGSLHPFSTWCSFRISFFEVATCWSTYLGARTLLGAPGLTTRSKKLLVTKGIATRSKNATSSSRPHYLLATRSY